MSYPPWEDSLVVPALAVGAGLLCAATLAVMALCELL